MALSASVLSAAIKTGLLADAGTGALNNAALTKVCDAIATAVVAHIVASGVVTVVTACGAGAGTGTGSIT